MRQALLAIAVGLLTLAVGLAFSMVVLGSQPEPSHQLKNGCSPFTVEVAIHDR